MFRTATMFSVVVALVLVQVTFALYNVLTKTALRGGLDPGVFVLLRDGSTAAVVSIAARQRGGEPKHFARPSGDRDTLRFWLLGVLGLYFGQYFVVLGLERGSAVLASTWSNCIPAATYLMGLQLGTERFDARERSAPLKLLGVALAVGGALGATVGGGSGGGSSAGPVPTGDTVLACAYFGLQVLLGGAGFWHLQKMLLAQYASLQVVAWYYQYGCAVLGLVILPTATHSAQWAFNGDDALALGVGVLLWPVAAYLLAFANDHGNPVLVMAFAPLQIVATVVLEYARDGTVPTRGETVGAAMVVLGLAAFIAGTTQEGTARAAGDKEEQTREAPVAPAPAPARAARQLVSPLLGDAALSSTGSPYRVPVRPASPSSDFAQE